ncbi:MAG: RNA polymerase sigma factor RpoD/SigA [Rubrobacteraceae bacterium]
MTQQATLTGGSVSGGFSAGAASDADLRLYLSRAARRPLLEHRAEVELARKAQGGCHHSRQALLESNLRLVVAVAKKYRGMGLPFDDLIQEGNIGLMRGIDKYDPETGNRLSTYATWWIRQRITRAIADKSRVVRLPVHFREGLRRLTNAERGLQQDLGREPTDEETAAELSRRSSKTSKVWDAEMVREARRRSRDVLSLEAPVGGGSDSHQEGSTSNLADFLDAPEPSPEELLVNDELSDHLRRALEQLPHREREIIAQRYGLGGEDHHTLEALAEKMGCRKQWIGQLQQRAETLLREYFVNVGAIPHA